MEEKDKDEVQFNQFIQCLVENILEKQKVMKNHSRNENEISTQTIC